MAKKLTVALIYDFDGTLSPGNMQEYDFIPAVGKSNREFWEESNQTAMEQDGDPILAYMYRMLHEAKNSGISLRRESFARSGQNIRLYEGVREWFPRINAYAAAKRIQLHHYINSSGLREMIEGTPIARQFKKIYASSFFYDVDGVAYWPAVAVNYTNKTQFIFKINKGIESVYDSERINEFIEEEKRPVQFRHMIYFGDGTTDIPCMKKLVKQTGGPLDRGRNPRRGQKRQTMEQAHPRQPRELHLRGGLQPRQGDRHAGAHDHRQDPCGRPAQQILQKDRAMTEHEELKRNRRILLGVFIVLFIAVVLIGFIGHYTK